MKYAGIGSRSTPQDIKDVMYQYALTKAALGHTLRSGGAQGADSAFEIGCLENNGPYEIFLARDATPEAIQLASEIHPFWSSCKPYVQRLHGRNEMIIAGESLQDPVDIVVCWTPDGEASGGTGQAIRRADLLNIPVANLHNHQTLQQIKDYIQKTNQEILRDAKT